MRVLHKKSQLILIVSLFVATVGACDRTRASNTEDAGLSDQIGIAECDEYLSKYSRCIADKVPSDHKKALEDALERTRSTWKLLGANPGARPGLPQACGLAMQTAQTALKKYTCAW